MSETPRPPLVVFSDTLDFVDGLHELATLIEGVDVENLRPVAFDATGLCIELVGHGVRRTGWCGGVHVGTVAIHVTERRDPETLKARLLDRLEADRPTAHVAADLPLPELVAAVRKAIEGG